MDWSGMAMAGLLAALLLLGEHYWIPPKKLNQPMRYMAGVATLNLSLTGLLASWGDWKALIALWIVTVLGGLAVLISYGMDHWKRITTALEIAEAEGKTLRSLHSEDQDGPEEK